MCYAISAFPPPCNSWSLSALIIQSQKLMRLYAARELSEVYGYKPKAAVTNLAHSCVSQRDIQVCCCVL